MLKLSFILIIAMLSISMLVGCTNSDEDTSDNNDEGLVNVLSNQEAWAVELAKQDWAKYTTEHRIEKSKTLPILTEEDVIECQKNNMCLARVENFEYGLIIELKDKDGEGEDNYYGISPESTQFERDFYDSGSEWDWKYEERRRVWDAIQK